MYKIKLYNHISDRTFTKQDFRVLVSLVIQMRAMFGFENVEVIEWNN